jgi:preprotein translocase subunit YajC
LLIFAAESTKKSPGLGLGNLLFPMLIIGFLFYFLLIRPQQREQARRRTMLASVKKNARVLTASGIYGVVTNVHAEADEVTVKVDEANNTKLRMTLSSIYRVLGDESSDEKSEKSSLK